MRAIISILLTAMLLLAADGVRADKAAAQKQFKAGLALFNAGDFEGAVVSFEESLKLFRTRAALFNLANAYWNLGRYSETLATLKLLEGEFGDVIDEQTKQAVAAIREEIAAITGTIEVRVREAGASIFVNEELVGRSPMPVPVLLGPGYHRVRVESGGRTIHDGKVRLAAGDKRVVEVKASAPSPPTAAPADDPPPVYTRDEEAGARRSVPLLVTSIIGTTAAIGMGATAGVFWQHANTASSDYNSYLRMYGELDPLDIDYHEAEEYYLGRAGQRKSDAELNNQWAVGLTVGAGIFAAASVVFWVLWARSGEEEGPAVALVPVPGGLGLSF